MRLPSEFVSSRLLLLCLLGLLVPGCAITPAPQPGKPAPDFSATLLDGTTVSLAGLRGKVVVLDFWATWCPPCREGLPHLQAIAVEPGLVAPGLATSGPTNAGPPAAGAFPSGLAVIAINQGEDSGTVRAFLRENRDTFPVALDPSGSIGRTFDVSELPTTIVINRDGTVRAIFTGFTPEIAAGIDRAIAAAAEPVR